MRRVRSKSKHKDQDERSERAQKRPTTASKRTKHQARVVCALRFFLCTKRIFKKSSGATRARSLCFILVCIRPGDAGRAAIEFASFGWEDTRGNSGRWIGAGRSQGVGGGVGAGG